MAVFLSEEAEMEPLRLSQVAEHILGNGLGALNIPWEDPADFALRGIKGFFAVWHG
jgi:hypothetical protein